MTLETPNTFHINNDWHKKISADLGRFITHRLHGMGSPNIELTIVVVFFFAFSPNISIEIKRVSMSDRERKQERERERG